MISDTPLIEVTYIDLDGEWDVSVTGANGRFDWMTFNSLVNVLIGHIPETIRADLEQLNDVCVTYTFEVDTVPSETQYGTGEGDVLTLPGYITTGRVVARKVYSLSEQRLIEEDKDGR